MGVTESPATDTAPTAYDAFLAELGREPTAAECEQWAGNHAGDPDEPRALVDAGWHTARRGDSERALALFRRAEGFGGEFGRHAQVGIIEQLFTLRRDQEADAAQQALRDELDDQPGGRGDLQVLGDMAEVLADADQPELAMEWCQAGLDRAAEAGDAAEVAEYRRGLRVIRDLVREELDLDRDDEDLAELAASEAAFQEAAKVLDRVFKPRKLEIPEEMTAFDGVVLRWVREDFTAVRSRWPVPTVHYGDDYETYAARIQRECRSYEEAGATRVRLVSGTLADYDGYARSEGRDPADQSTRQNYGEWCTTARPGQVQSWPPARNDMCWCDSGRKYKKCCGAPAGN